MVDQGRKLAMAGLLAGCVQGCGPAPPPVPVCGDPGVLQQVEESMRARGRALVMDVPPVGEVSVDAAGPVGAAGPASPPLAHCAVRGHTVGYDTNRYGASPVYEPFLVNYTVEIRRNGLFVRVE